MPVLILENMDALLIALLLLPVLGSLPASLAGSSNRWGNRLMRTSGPAAAVLCMGVMAAIVYRRFYLPLGARQLEINWGDWFSVPPLTVPFALRMDTLAGVLCGIVVLAGAAIQLAAGLRKDLARARPRGTLSALLGAILLFVLADNLVTVAAALVATGPLLAIGGFRRSTKSGVDPEKGDRVLQILVVHGIGDALTLFGLFFIYGSLGTVSYSQIAAQVSGLPGVNVQAAVGASLLLGGIALRSGPGLLEALLPPAGAVYVGFRLEKVAAMIPVHLLYVAGVASGLWALANLAPLGAKAGNVRRLFALSRQFRKLAKEFFADFLENFFLRGIVYGPARVVNFLGRKTAKFVSTLKGGMIAAAILAAIVALAWWSAA